MKLRVLLSIFLALSLSNSAALADQDFTAVFEFTGGGIYGYPPKPQDNGFDYFFTPVMVDPAILGDGVTIESVEVSASGTNLGAVINFDWEVHIGAASFGLPVVQFTQTLVDPADGYTRNAPVQFRFVIGSSVDPASYTFSGQKNFTTGATSASPYLSIVKAAFASPLNLSSGLYAQLFLWTADNRNSRISFGTITLTVHGSIPADPVYVDVSPGGCPNPLNTKAKGVMSVAILGTEDFDVTTIDPASISLEGAPPLRWSYGDVATPFTADIEFADDCNELRPDGYNDLVLKFNKQEVVNALGDVQDGDVVIAELSGNLIAEFGGTPIEGVDVILIVSPSH